MNREIEKEMKLKLSREQYELLNGFDGKSTLLKNHYFFAEKRGFTGFTLRIREENGSFTLTRKTGKDSGGTVVSVEESVALSSEDSQGFMASGITSDKLREFFGNEESDDLFVYVGCLQTLRKNLTLAGAECELDSCEYLGVKDYELECEDCERFEALTAYLNSVGITEPSVSKRRRFEKRLEEIKNR